MKKILLYLWQLSQNLLGLLVICITSAKRGDRLMGGHYFTKNIDAGVCLGEYIITPLLPSYLTIAHERGHQKQSRILGWFYLPLVGLPSIMRNIYNRIFKKGSAWYYSGYPENWADKLAGVER